MTNLGHKRVFVLRQLTGVDFSSINIKTGQANRLIGLLRKAKAGQEDPEKAEQEVKKYIADWSWGSKKDTPKSDPAPASSDPDEVRRLMTKVEQQEKLIKEITSERNDSLAAIERLKKELEEALASKTKPVPPTKGREMYIKPNVWDEVIVPLQDKGSIHNILVSGPAGCGKSKMAKEIAKALKLDFFTVSFSGGVRYAQVFGTTQIKKDGSTEWVPSELLRAVQRPGLVLLDEVFAADANVLIGLNSLLETDSRSFLSPIGEIKVHENCRFIACANTLGRTKDTKHLGAQRADDSLLDRFCVVHMNYDTNVEKTILEKLGIKSDELLKRTSNLRDKLRTNQINFEASTRRLITCARLMISGLGFEKAFEMAFLNSLSKTERSMVC